MQSVGDVVNDRHTSIIGGNASFCVCCEAVFADLTAEAAFEAFTSCEAEQHIRAFL